MNRQLDFDRVREAVLGLGKSYHARLGAGALVAFLGCRWLNAFLSRRALMNGVRDRTWDWDKEIVLLTGGSSGIGSMIARKLAEKRVKVIIIDVQPPKAPLPPNQYYYQVDITSSEEIKKFAAQLRGEHGDPTVLINNAGVGNARPIVELPEAALRRVFDVNIISHFILLREFLPSIIRANHGHIVTLASMASFETRAQNVDYAAAKAGALSLHEGLGQELKHIYKAPSVRTTVVHPSWIRTPMISKLVSNPKFRESVNEPETVANAIVRQLYRGEGNQLVVPPSLWWMSTVRSWPSWLQENFRDTVSKALIKVTQP